VKNIASGAMAAIEAGEAIVTGAVKITPLGQINYTTVGTVDLDAVTNGSLTAAGGLSVGVELSGFDPTDIVRVTLLGGDTWNDSHGGVNDWRAFFAVIPDGDSGDMFTVGSTASYVDEATAYASFGSRTFTGGSTYEFFIYDNVLISDNTGGMSILVERGVQVGDADPILLWGGYGPIEIDSEDYLGIGARGLAQQNGGAIGGIAQGITLSVSGVEPAALALLDAEQVKGGSVVLYRLVFAGDGKTLLDAHVFDRGRVDSIDTDETIGDEAAVILNVESAARGLGRSGARRRADSDQRLIDVADGYFKNTAYAGQKTLYWGGKKPSHAR
jgi:hypothetical protein